MIKSKRHLKHLANASKYLQVHNSQLSRPSTSHVQYIYAGLIWNSWQALWMSGRSVYLQSCQILDKTSHWHQLHLRKDFLASWSKYSVLLLSKANFFQLVVRDLKSHQVSRVSNKYQTWTTPWQSVYNGHPSENTTCSSLVTLECLWFPQISQIVYIF